jgi:hypothetical protein
VGQIDRQSGDRVRAMRMAARWRRIELTAKPASPQARHVHGDGNRVVGEGLAAEVGGASARRHEVLDPPRDGSVASINVRPGPSPVLFRVAPQRGLPSWEPSGWQPGLVASRSPAGNHISRQPVLTRPLAILPGPQLAPDDQTADAGGIDADQPRPAKGDDHRCLVVDHHHVPNHPPCMRR